jgi:hypothetical protein
VIRTATSSGSFSQRPNEQNAEQAARDRLPLNGSVARLARTIDHQRCTGMLKPIAMFFWRKVDHPGHDSCRLFRLANGWRLSGAAVFWDEGRPCHFHYEVSADAAWRARSAKVSGFFGKKAVDLRIRSAGPGRWEVNGVSKASVRSCVDIDLGFTPATNLIALRRLSLKVGQCAEAPAAYLQFPEMRLVVLLQTYRRIGRTEYDYEAPAVGYSRTLQVLPSGVVIRYPGLFERVASG